MESQSRRVPCYRMNWYPWITCCTRLPYVMQCGRSALSPFIRHTGPPKQGELYHYSEIFQHNSRGVDLKVNEPS